jgi:hypothetical protein
VQAHNWTANSRAICRQPDISKTEDCPNCSFCIDCYQGDILTSFCCCSHQTGSQTSGRRPTGSPIRHHRCSCGRVRPFQRRPPPLPFLIGGVHISARALFHIYLIWFGSWLYCSPIPVVMGCFTRSNDFACLTSASGGGGVGWGGGVFTLYYEPIEIVDRSVHSIPFKQLIILNYNLPQT